MPPPYVLEPAATPIEITIIKGETYQIVLPVLDDDDALVDVTGYTARVQVRRSESEPLLHEWSSANGKASCSAVGVTLEVLAADTAAWTWKDALISADVLTPIVAAPKTFAEGPIHARPNISR
jgi:hypothetical protein